MSHDPSAADSQLTQLCAFRQAVYSTLHQARDALFDLADAVLLTPALPSFAHLAASPAFRRAWPSLYAALTDGHWDQARLLPLYAAHVRPPALAPAPAPLLLAGDHTVWPRPHARTLPDRTYAHQPAPLPGCGGRPITAGHAYSTLAWVPEAAGSWALPLLHERLTPTDSPLAKAATQLQQGLAALPADVPIVALYDSEYGCAPFVAATAALPCTKLLRLRPNLRLFEAPPPYKGRGPHPKHGTMFKLHDPATWGNTDELLWTVDRALGWVLVQVWHALHFRAAAQVPLTVIRISRPGARGTRRDPKAQWLAWRGPDDAPPPPVEEWWALYGRRFAVDHWYRFVKQRLYWTVPQVGSTHAGEVWSGLMVLVTWELWLGRGVVADRPLPWQRGQAAAHRTPGRVCAGMGAVLVRIGTPSRVPKRRGKAPGWEAGRARTVRERRPVCKKPQKGRPGAATAARAGPQAVA